MCLTRKKMNLSPWVVTDSGRLVHTAMYSRVHTYFTTSPNLHPLPYLPSLQTLHDLMDKSELEQLSPSEGAPVLAADKKRRNLEENMRREAEERKKKKRELLRREQEYEKVWKPFAVWYPQTLYYVYTITSVFGEY